jgi:hypothetical protein
MKQVIIAALMLAAFSIPVTTALVAMIVVVAPTSAYAQIGANSKYSKQGWRNGVWCRNVQSARCQARAAQKGKGTY